MESWYLIIITESQTAKECHTDKKPFYVFVPGLTSGGPNMTVDRQELTDVFIPSSLSTPPVGLKTKERSTQEHYQNLATEITKRAAGKNLCLVGHSMGGLELIETLEAMLEKDGFKDRHVDLTCISTPGFTARGFLSLSDFSRRFMAFMTRYPYHKQHIAYPLPEIYYERMNQEKK